MKSISVDEFLKTLRFGILDLKSKRLQILLLDMIFMSRGGAKCRCILIPKNGGKS